MGTTQPCQKYLKNQTKSEGVDRDLKGIQGRPKELTHPLMQMYH